MTERETLKSGWMRAAISYFWRGWRVPAESHIPDFRSTDGLYNQQYDYPPETILSHSFYMRKPEEILPILPEQDAVSERGAEQSS